MTKIVLKIQNVTCPQTLENKGNTHNIISMDNILIWPACGSGKKYKQCHGRPGHENDPIPVASTETKPKTATKKETKKTTKKK